MEGISIIGPGRVGGALALALDRAGAAVDAIVYRGGGAEAIRDAMSNNAPRLIAFESICEITSPILLITSGDPDIEHISAALSACPRPGTVVLHTSGSLSSDVLVDLRNVGCFVGSMHPLAAISDPFLGSRRFRDAYFCVEGDVPARAAAESIVAKLGGNSFSIATKYKALYHAAAVTASGHIVTIVDAAIEMLRACGLEAETAKAVLTPLVRSTVENLAAQRPSDALTGTFARADAAAFERHLNALSSAVAAPDISLYLSIAERSLTLAEIQGVDPARTAALRKRISIAKIKYE